LLKELRGNSALFDVDIACDQCNSEHRIKKARQIEPLRRLSVAIREKLHRRPITQREIPPQLTPTELLERQSSGNSKSISTLPSRRSTGSNRTSLSERGAITTGSLTKFLDEPPGNLSGPRIASYCFSADGNGILVWGRTEARIAFYNINTGDIERNPAAGVTFAAAGADLYAVISQNGNVLLSILIQSQG
jgi:hypothetical protein